MEAVGELAPNQAPRLGQISSAPFEPVPPSRALRAVPPAGRFGDGSSSQPESDGGQPSLLSDGDGSGDLARSLALLRALSSTAVADAALRGFREAADFADNVEKVSRTVEYLQIVAAGAVDRTRREAAAAARSGSSSGSGGSGAGGAVGWTTGWGAETAAADPGQTCRPGGHDFIGA